MPNHVTTKLTIEGPPEAVERFAAMHLITFPATQAVNWDDTPLFNPDGTPKMEEAFVKFDFETIIPRPKCLDGIVCGSETDLAVEAITGKTPHELTGKGFPRGTFFPLTAEHKARQEEAMDKLTVEQLAKGLKAVAAIEECGYVDWYYWSIDNWGTKWNSYEFELVDQDPEKLTFRFQTAWSVPLPILQKLVELHPQLSFVAKSFDEMWNFAALTTSTAYRKLTYLEVKPDAKMYEDVYGEAAPIEEEA